MFWTRSTMPWWMKSRHSPCFFFVKQPWFLQDFQVPKTEGCRKKLYFWLFWGVGFFLHKLCPYSLYRWVHPFLVYTCLVMVPGANTIYLGEDEKKWLLILSWTNQDFMECNKGFVNSAHMFKIPQLKDCPENLGIAMALWPNCQICPLKWTYEHMVDFGFYGCCWNNWFRMRKIGFKKRSLFCLEKRFPTISRGHIFVIKNLFPNKMVIVFRF